jgi:hypothetical protein
MIKCAQVMIQFGMKTCELTQCFYIIVLTWKRATMRRQVGPLSLASEGCSVVIAVGLFEIQKTELLISLQLPSSFIVLIVFIIN